MANKITLNTKKDYLDFIEMEEKKEKSFLEKHEGPYFFRAYKYYQNYTNIEDFSCLSILIDDVEFLEFPLNLEIIENPMMVEVIGGEIKFFEDPQKAFSYANELFKKGKNVIIEGRGLSYDYEDDFYFINIEKQNAELLKLVER